MSELTEKIAREHPNYFIRSGERKCEGCHAAYTPAPWPCATARAITEAVGL